MIASLLPRTILHAGMKAYARSGLQTQLGRVGHGEVFCTTVEPTPASVAGAKVIETYTVAPLVEGGLSMVVNFRGDQLDIGVCVCPDTVPAVEDIATGIAHYLDVLTAAAERSPRGQGRSVVSNMASHVARHSGSVDLC